MSHLRFGPDPRMPEYEIQEGADYIACGNTSYVRKFDLIKTAREGGTFVLNTPWTNMEELEAEMPDKMKRTIAEKKLEFYTIDASKVAKEIGLGQRINTVMQAVFYHLSGVLPKEEAVQLLKDDIVKLYSKKGPAVVQMNHDAVDASVANLNKIDVPAAWSQATNDTLGYGSGKSNTLGFMLQRMLLQRLYNVPSLTDDLFAFYVMFFNVLMFQCNFNRCYNSFCTD